MTAKTLSRLLCTWCIGFAALALTTATSHAQTSVCGPSDSKVEFSDGSSTCLKEFGLLKNPVWGEAKKNFATYAAENPKYVLTLNADPQMCPFAQKMYWHSSLRVQEKDATSECEARLKQSLQTNGKAPAASCTCEVLIHNGVTKLTPADFLAKTQLYERQITLNGRPLQIVDEEIARAKKQEDDRKFAEAEAARKRATEIAQQKQRDDALKEKQRQEELEAARKKKDEDEVTRLAEAEKRRREREEENRKSRPSGPIPIPQALAKLTAAALVIGNSNYLNYTKLPNSINDAQAIATKLMSFGIEVDLVMDADRDKLVKALNVYKAKARSKDVNLLFYAGHGQEWDGENYLIPTNMSKDGITPGFVKLNAMPLSAMLDYMPAKTKLVFLDSCRERPPGEARGTPNIGFAAAVATRGTMIAFATAPGRLAADSVGGKNSPYTTALLAHLDAPLDIRILMGRVRQTVLDITADRQEPWENSSLVGDQFVLSQMTK